MFFSQTQSQSRFLQLASNASSVQTSQQENTFEEKMNNIESRPPLSECLPPTENYKDRLRLSKKRDYKDQLSSISSESSLEVSNDDEDFGHNAYVFPDDINEVYGIIEECGNKIKELEDEFLKEEFKDEGTRFLNLRIFSQK